MMGLPPSLRPRLLLASAVLAGATAGVPSPVALSVPNAAASVWDTDPSKAGVELQIINTGSALADDVRVTSVDVSGGTLAAAHSTLPILLGNVAPQRSALFDLVITVPRTHTAEYLLTISGTYRHSGMLQRFTLTRSVTPSVAPPPIRAKSGVLDTAPNQPTERAWPPGPGAPAGFGPNATTPMLIPPGPPR